MKHLIIFAHPNGHNSFNRAILDKVIQASHRQNIEYKVRDLYSLDFNPVLSWEEIQGSFQGIIPQEIKYEHQLIAQAELITLVYPLWWMGFPALLKGYLDRVLSYGFAYKTENGLSVGLLGGKRLQQFVTIGSNLEKYKVAGFTQSLQDCLVDGLFNFCGINNIKHQLFGDIHLLDEASRIAILEQVEQITLDNLADLVSAES